MKYKLITAPAAGYPKGGAASVCKVKTAIFSALYMKNINKSLDKISVLVLK
jgi:hypothetical protein